MGRTSFCVKIIYKFFLKTHQQNRVFSLYYRVVFFYCGEIKCKQGVKNFDEMPVMLSVNQAAEVLGIFNVSLYKLIEKDKSFPVVQLGRRKSIPKEQLKEWIYEKSKR